MSEKWSEYLKKDKSQYDRCIAALKKRGKKTSRIEHAVRETIKNLETRNTQSFVIFGEPQSGKTEMMIALNARLLDKGHRIIVNLLTDSVDLLGQNLTRFKEAHLKPAPVRFDDLPREPNELKDRSFVVLCKKNANDLRKLINSLRAESNLILIDDEADYASPDGNVNNKDSDPTKINKLISKLMENGGTYIGVTATPARLDLNNTFANESENWVEFGPHDEYVGHDFFFPSDGDYKYRLRTIPANSGNEKADIQKAVLHYLCGVAELHQLGKPNQYTMLVHTSGKTSKHSEDFRAIDEVLAILSNPKSPKLQKWGDKLLNVARYYNPKDPRSIVEFIFDNIEDKDLVLINSRGSKHGRGPVAQIAEPTTLFSFGVGGNIISRGVTFDNLLSMYFTRSVKGNFTQDTYIQRARMFGTRNAYKEYFQLWIPDALMGDWTKCFVLHGMALESRNSGSGIPIWVSDSRVVPTASGSIDKSVVDFKGGERPFALFDYDDNAKETIERLFDRKGRDDLDMLNELKEFFDKEDELPSHVCNYMRHRLSSGQKGAIAFHKPSFFGGPKSNYSPAEKKNIRRNYNKGVFGNNQFARTEGENPKARHHLKIFYNEWDQARLFYKVNGEAIKFTYKKQ